MNTVGVWKVTTDALYLRQMRRPDQNEDIIFKTKNTLPNGPK